MKTVGLLGCGVVGTETARRIMRRADLTLAGIAVCDPAKRRPADLAPLITTDARALATDENVDIVIEAIGGIEPARTLVEAALLAGKTVVTANKALVAAHGPELEAIGDLRYEAAVAAAVPVIAAIDALNNGDTITAIEGVLNGTANVVLGLVDQGHAFHDALDEARRLGYAEPDPSRDIDGRDVADKLCVLAHRAFKIRLKPDDVARHGIEHLPPAPPHHTWRLIGRVDRDGNATVSPTAVPHDHPFARLHGPENAVAIETEHAGRITLTGPGAGPAPTATALLTQIDTTID